MTSETKGPRTEPIAGELFRGKYPPLGLFVWEFAMAGTWPVLATTGLDFGVIDMEHSAFSYRDVGTMLSGARSTSLPALVRVPELNRNTIGRVLDLGADGVILPHVTSEREAAELVSYTKFAPQGLRNVAFGCPHDGYGSTRLSLSDFAAVANANTVCVPMIEDMEGVAAAEEICQTPGVDAVWLGFADLSHALGAIGDYESDAFADAEAQVLRACADAGIPTGVVAGTSELAVRQLRRGYGAVALGTDLTVLQNGLTDLVRHVASARDPG